MIPKGNIYVNVDCEGREHKFKRATPGIKVQLSFGHSREATTQKSKLSKQTCIYRIKKLIKQVLDLLSDQLLLISTIKHRLRPYPVISAAASFPSL